MKRYWLHLKSNPIFWLVLILLVAGIVRFWHIESLPNGFYWDEAAITYDAWGISIDGKDQWGVSFPLVFTSYGDGKLPFTEYLLALFFKMGGFHLYWVRYLVAAFGVLLVGGVFMLTRKLFPRSFSLGLLAALFTGLSSWAIHFSRFGLEAGIGTALMVWSVSFLYQSNKRVHDGIGILLLVLSAYTYHGNLLIAPLMLVMVGWKKIRTILFIGLMVPLIFALTQSSWTRAEQTLFWNESGYSITVSDIVSRIGSHFSPVFWISGNQLNLRQFVPHYFILYPIELLFLVIGLFGSFRESRKVAIWLWMGLGIGLLPSLVGNPSPHTIRALNMLPFIKIIESYGIYWLYKKSKIIAVGVGCLYALSFCLFWRYYTTTYKIVSAPDFQYGYKELMSTLKQQSNPLRNTYVLSTEYGQPYIYTLLYWKISPPEYRSGGLANMSFRLIKWPEPVSETTFYAGSPNEIPPTDPRVKTVLYYPESTTPVWVIAQ